MKKYEIATFGAGCFWGVEAAFQKIKGVMETVVGYMGGNTVNPSYEEVCSDKTGHIEVVQILFDPEEISYFELLDVFWKSHDPTQKDRQGPDIGTQYKSVIFYHSDDQKNIAIESKNKLELSRIYNSDIATEILPSSTFYRAEEYHQKYFDKNNLSNCKI